MTIQEEIHYTLNQILKELKVHHNDWRREIGKIKNRYKELEEARKLLDATRKVYDIIVSLDLDKIQQVIEEG